MDQLDIRWKQRFDNYQKALTKLKDYAEQENLNELESQGLIKAFEYTFELAWKTLQDYIGEVKGTPEVKGPRPVIMDSFKEGFIHSGEVWMAMLRDRNRSTHTYDEAISKEIIKAIRTEYLHLLIELETKFLQNF